MDRTCAGVTRKGQRCSRKTCCATFATKCQYFCWQHCKSTPGCNFQARTSCWESEEAKRIGRESHNLLVRNKPEEKKRRKKKKRKPVKKKDREIERKKRERESRRRERERKNRETITRRLERADLAELEELAVAEVLADQEEREEREERLSEYERNVIRKAIADRNRARDQRELREQKDLQIAERARAYNDRENLIAKLEVHQRKRTRVKKKKAPQSRGAIQLVPSVFTFRGRPGDYEYERELKGNENALFIFNDNVEDMSTDKQGGGNARFRPWAFERWPRAVGIPTGSKGLGFARLHERIKNHTAKFYIDIGLDKLDKLLDTGDYNKVFYSANDDGTLGARIFIISKDIKLYIVNNIKAITRRRRT